MQLDLQNIYSSANRIYNNNPSLSPIQIKQEKESSSISTSIETNKVSTVQSTLEHQISNDKDIKAIVNDENLLSNEDALKKELLQNVLEEIKGSSVNVHPNSISLNSTSFNYTQKESMSNSYMQYGGIYDTKSEDALGHIYAHYAHIEEETSFAMKMEFTVKTPNEEFNVNINISYTQSFKQELYEENLILKNQVNENKNVGYYSEKNVSSEVKNANVSLDESHDAYLSQETQTYSQRVDAHKGDNFTYKEINAKEESAALAFFNKDNYKTIPEAELNKPIIQFDKDIKDKSQFENINLVFDASPYDSLNLEKSNGFLDFADSISSKPKEKPLYLRIWEEKIKKEEIEKAKEEKALELEHAKETKEEQDKLLALFQEDIGFIYLSEFSSQSKELTFKNNLEKVQLTQDENGLPLIFEKTDISI